MQVKTQRLELNVERLTDSKLGKEYINTVYCHSAYLTFMRSTTCKMLGWINHKLESRLPGEISANSDMQMMAYLPSNSRKQRRTKEPLDEDERGEWKSWLKTWHSKNEDHDIQSHHFMANRRVNGSSDRFYFLEPPNHCSWWLQPWNKKTVAAWKESYDEPRQDVKKHRYNCADKGLYSQSYGFSSSHAQIWELDHKEGWALQNWCFQTVVLDKTIEHLLDCKEIKQINPKGNQPWIFFRRTDAQTEASILRPPDAKFWLIGKDPDAGKNWSHRSGQRRWDGWMASPTQWTCLSKWWKTGMPGVLYSSWGHKKSDTTKWLNNKMNEKKINKILYIDNCKTLRYFSWNLIMQKTSFFINRNELYIQKS